MPPLNFVGRPASLDRHVMSELEVDSKLSGGVSLEYVTAKADQTISQLATKSYVDNQDSQFTYKSYVDSQDALLLPTSQRGAANGTVPLDATGKVSVNYLPKIAGGVIRGPYQPTNVYTSSGITAGNSALIARWTIANPGFQWWPIVFGNVRFWTGTGGRGAVECRIADSGFVVSGGNSLQVGGDGGDIHTAYVVPASHSAGETPGSGYAPGQVSVTAWGLNRGLADSNVQISESTSIRLALYLLKTSI